eukprot:2512722-Pleurochrysis_carterae.AAC.1
MVVCTMRAAPDYRVCSRAQRSDSLVCCQLHASVSVLRETTIADRMRVEHVPRLWDRNQASLRTRTRAHLAGGSDARRDPRQRPRFDRVALLTQAAR